MSMKSQLCHVTGFDLRRFGCLGIAGIAIGGFTFFALARSEAAEVVAQPGDSVANDFEGVKPSWHLEESASLAGVRSHKRTDVAAHSGRRSESIWVFGRRGGERILATHDIPPAAAISEFGIRLWVRGNRPGYQLMARVRLPRTKNDRGQAAEFYVHGDRYLTKGAWEELRLENISEKIVAGVRTLRLKYGREVDPNQAYIDQVLINTFGGAGSNRLWIDDLTVVGFVPALRDPQHPEPHTPIRLTHYASASSKENSTPSAALGTPEALGTQPPMTWVARAVRHNGESFALLRRLGFNTVWLSATATPTQLKQARELEIFLICPAPRYSEIGPVFDRVIAWSLEPKSRSDLSTYSGVQGVRGIDPRRRPLIGRATEVDPIHADSAIRVTTAEDASSRPSTGRTWRLLGSPLVPSSRWHPLRAQVWAGVVDGCSGFVLNSTSSLEQPKARHSRHLAELLNLELRMLRPWIAGSPRERFEVDGEDLGVQIAGLSDLHSGIVFVQRAHAYQGNHSSWTEIELPITAGRDVFRMEPGGLSPVVHQRVPGGTRIELSATKPEGILLMTDRAAIIEDVSRYLSTAWPKTSELLVDVLQAELLDLDRRLQHSVDDVVERDRLRQQVLALRGRIAPLLRRESGQMATFRQLDHVLGQLERVHERIGRSP